ncbi:hypothetical protein LINPERHAP1_LOCUS37027 [Linum perenne]
MHSGIVSNNFRVPFQLPKHRLVIHCSGTLSETPVVRYLSRKFLQNWWVARGQSFIMNIPLNLSLREKIMPTHDSDSSLTDGFGKINLSVETTPCCQNQDFTSRFPGK